MDADTGAARGTRTRRRRRGTGTGTGYTVLRHQVPAEAVDAALRRIHLDVLCNGLDLRDIGLWLRAMHWFPHLKWEPELTALAEHLPEGLRCGEMCDPQIVLQMPDVDTEVELESHVDQPPDWANGRGYLRIVGVALSPSRESTGGLVVWPLDGGETEAVELEPGDAVVMDPALPHTSGLNREGIIRYAVYFRFLEQ
jgi:ectoine hydroxylase-related dioxygenase (phytanoyl-CoA dioxygenase family)